MPEPALQHTDVATAFNAIAPVFESRFENEVTAKIRGTIYESIRKAAPLGSSILDINCGIGIDALALAAEGYSVTGVDLSPGMIDQAKRRAAMHPELKVEFLVSSFEDLAPLEGRTFDVVLSNFAGLNCTDSLHAVFPRIAKLLHPRGKFLAVAMPKASLWEIFAGLSRLRPGSAFRRFARTVRATGFHQYSFDVHYHPLRRFLSASACWFDPVGIRALSLLSPPPHAQTFRNRFPGTSELLDKLDDHLCSLPVLRGMGDHYFVMLQRNAAAVSERLRHE
ncbi:MAG: class I SAM-dependent methyltransferase [Bacteroidota bacterium]